MMQGLSVNETGPLDYLRALMAVDRLNSHSDELGVMGHVPETEEIVADAQVCGHVSRVLGIYAPLTYEALKDEPVVEVRRAAGWLTSKLDTEEDFDAAKALVRWATKRGKDAEVLRDMYEEATEREDS
jgi:hypothetical protein